MMIAVFALESAQFHEGFNDKERREAAETALHAVNQALKQTPEWDKLWLVASRAARFAGQEEVAAAALGRARGAADVAKAVLGKGLDTLSSSTRTAVEVSTTPVVAMATDDPKQPLTVLVRPNIETLALNGSEIEAMRLAFERIWNQPPENAESIRSITAFYEEYRSPSFSSAPTIGPNLFLPWNRAFLAYIEGIIRENDPDFSMPCWTVPAEGLGRVPEAFRQFASETRNPLNAPRSEEANEGKILASNIVSALSSLMSQTKYDAFTEKLEHLSNRRHIAVGGWMSDPSLAAGDPLFYAHACGVDRIWAQWEANRGGTVKYDDTFLNQKLEPFGLTVKDVLNTQALGYTYDFLPVK